jgi:hypothetical protein
MTEMRFLEEHVPLYADKSEIRNVFSFRYTVTGLLFFAVVREILSLIFLTYRAVRYLVKILTSFF